MYQKKALHSEKIGQFRMAQATGFCGQNNKISI